MGEERYGRCTVENNHGMFCWWKIISKFLLFKDGRL